MGCVVSLMKCDRQLIYCPDTLIQEARVMGLSNLSGFVREQLKEFIAVRNSPSKTSSEPATACTPVKKAAP